MSIKSTACVWYRCAAAGKEQVIEHLYFGSYIAGAAANSAAGIRTPELITAHNRAYAVFLCVALSHLSMVGRAGQPQGWPVSVVTGSSNPVRLTAHEIRTSGGELLKLTTEDARMATTPTQTHPEFEPLIRYAFITSSLVECAKYLSMNGDADTQRYVTDLLILAAERCEELARRLEAAEQLRRGS